jgi:hypothetical protein
LVDIVAAANAALGLVSFEALAGLVMLEKVGRVARQRVNGVITTSPGASRFISLPSCGRSAVVPVIFSRNIFPHPADFSCLTWPLSSWAAVETRA